MIIGSATKRLAKAPSSLSPLSPSAQGLGFRGCRVYGFWVILNPKPETLNPKPQTLNLKPYTRPLGLARGCDDEAEMCDPEVYEAVPEGSGFRV